MRRFILTGTPGSGKTSILRALELAGHVVVEEAASDVIALQQALGIPEPWSEPSFIDQITGLQRQRQIQAAALPSSVQFFDRSPICTHALATYLGHPVSARLREEVARIRDQGIYQSQVFFIANLGFCAPTAARRISFADSLRFERVHAETYRDLGYDCIPVAAMALPERVAQIEYRVAMPDDEPGSR